MIFCSNCFRDVQIKSMIESNNKKGTCPICGKRNTFLYETDKDMALNDFFNDLIMIYTPQESLPNEYPRSEMHMLADELSREWNIFSVDMSSNNIYEIIKSLSANLYSSSPNLFDTPVGVPEKYDEEYLKEHSILRGNTWGNFVECIKHDNRFHTQMINTKILSTYLSYLRKDYPKGKIMFRGRLCRDDNGFFKPSEMGAPPKEHAKDGRANACGISRLYLADSEKTCIHEIRSGAFDVISVGRFKLNEDISVIDFKQIKSFSPFNGDFDFLEYLINKPVLQKIDEEMGRAVRTGDNHLDYVATQYLCDFIKTLEYDVNKSYSGVEYSSTLNADGYNLAIFYPNLFKCTRVCTYRVRSIDYDYV